LLQPEDDARLLDPGRTAWRLERAERAALLIDNQAYFAAAKAAMRKAQRTVWLLGWTFDPRTRLDPRGKKDREDQVGVFLRRLAASNPELDVRVLVWQSQIAVSMSQGGYPQRAAPEFVGSRVNFRLDATTPFGACHHQKALIIDGRLAFVGGGDFSVDRWDTPDHPDRERGRLMPSGKLHAPRHEVMMMVEGPVAHALAQLFRERWRRATRDLPPNVAAPEDGSPWPDGIAPEFDDVAVAIARTEPNWRNRPGADEIEALHVRSIMLARERIYLENQYVTSPVIADLLAKRLSEADGPEVVIVTTRQSPSWFDQMTMDRARNQFIARLMAADRYGRFRAYTPVTRGGDTIIVHSKVSIIDDRLVRAGSANLNARSGGFDTECDVAIEAHDEASRAAVRGFRHRLLAHWVHVPPETFAVAEAAHGLGDAVERLDAARARRLRPLEPGRAGVLAQLVTRYGLGDPAGPHDSWRPWLRDAALREERARLRHLALD
jgi:phosphatidylserine/phosphatidylglycerophosphate/cardiolipin synthase-like enzyme